MTINFIDTAIKKVYNIYNLRGRTGFDGDFEARGASSGGRRFKKSKLNIKANDNLAYAA